MSDLLWAGLALMLVFEGLLPFLSPNLWRQLFARMLAMTDGQIRFVGLTSMLGGVVILYVLLN